MCDEIEQAQNLEQHTIEIGIANRKPAMTFTGLCHFSVMSPADCSRPVL
ncbi:hypothetical protein [Yersinia rohdei]|nr:hypothetical protein [Yersinia rohdei]MDN0096230.1 hypothetical protein [Yersinia rohdei]